MASSPVIPDLASLSISTPTPMSEQEQEDWDRELARMTPLERAQSTQSGVGLPPAPLTPTHPRNSVAFPGPADRYPPSFSPGRTTRFSTGARSGEGESDGEDDGPGAEEGEDGEGRKGKRTRRTLSALLRLHSERGADGGAGRFTEAEAARIADVLGQWINSSSSPYESAADDFAFAGSQDDLALGPNIKKPTPQTRPRGRSEGVWASEAAS
ncbi:hypothetical protein BDN70DRAFT_923795 [Pholiota conissans]|uniref:Uncharacterized protein n=1 Tax=Pholiota conissans TaxID=109636 RepID=A0A9P6CWJ8_9AGAR|nr:hypothetical protein BDN70DRAFT_923795 [Pholiota conissans]